MVPFKTRNDSKGDEKKVFSKISSLSTKNLIYKVGLQFILHGFEVAHPVSFSSPWSDLSEMAFLTVLAFGY